MGAGTSSGKTGAATQITRAKFTNSGNGTWDLDINGVGGAQILDETGGSRDPMGGRGGKYYGITAWDKNYAIQPVQYIQGSLNDAKSQAKQILKKLNNV